MGGSFQTNRDIFGHTIWQDVVKFRIFFYIYGNAVFAKEGVQKGSVHINRGQLLKSYRSLINDLEYIENKQVKKYSLSTVQRKIKELVKEGRLLTHETELGTLFEVVNYEVYQGFGQYEKQDLERDMKHSRNTDGTVEEHSWNNNKNVKNEKNEKKSSSSKPQLSSGPENPFNAFHMAFGPPNTFVMDDINFYLDEGMEEKAISYAIEKAAKNGSKFQYAKGILDNWLRDNIFTYEAAVAKEEEFNKRKVERIHATKRPQTNRPTPNIKGTDISTLDFSRSRSSL